MNDVAVKKKIAELTTEDYRKLLDEYFATPEKRAKMTDEAIREIAKKLNEKIDVPLIRETREEKILIKIVLKIDRFLYDNLPNEFYDLVRSLEDGIDDEEATRLVSRLSTMANQHINIAYVPESVEYFAIRFVIGIIINSARKGWDLAKAKLESEHMLVPDSKNPSDQLFANMVM